MKQCQWTHRQASPEAPHRHHMTRFQATRRSRVVRGRDPWVSRRLWRGSWKTTSQGPHSTGDGHAKPLKDLKIQVLQGFWMFLLAGCLFLSPFATHGKHVGPMWGVQKLQRFVALSSFFAMLDAD